MVSALLACSVDMGDLHVFNERYYLTLKADPVEVSTRSCLLRRGTSLLSRKVESD